MSISNPDTFSRGDDAAGASFFDSLIQENGFEPAFDDVDYENSHNESNNQPSMEEIQNLYYTKGLEELESLQLLDLLPLATWKLSSFKQGFGLEQLRNDSPNTYWQSDGSTENNMERSNSDGMHLNYPHSVNLQFAKKVSLERISIFTNYQLDESYTPLKIRIMAGGSNWDLTEVCVVSLDKPIGWSHIIFKGVRGDGLLKCFVVKIIISANHQDGKDSHIRAIRCFGKKTASTAEPHMGYILRDTSLSSHTSVSGILLNHELKLRTESMDSDEEDHDGTDSATTRILLNVTDVLGFNTGFDSLELQSIASIR